eukprot:106407_1
MCIDKVGSGCAPPKQIFYFDISRPNTYIEDAAHINATLVTPQIETCDPTVSPSNHPTQSPSNEPSVNPSRATANPSITPSRTTANPSITPSLATANPTASPSYHPTKSSIHHQMSRQSVLYVIHSNMNNLRLKLISIVVRTMDQNHAHLRRQKM